MLRIWATLWGAIGVMLAAHGLIAAPAENPPDDFTARQYIDSAGCVFVLDEAGEWLARVGRDGQPVCGYPPTFSPRTGGADPAVAASPTGDEIADNLLMQIVTTLGPEALGTRPDAPAAPEADPRDKENGLVSASPLAVLNRTIAVDGAVKHAMGEALQPNARLCELLGGKPVSSVPGALGEDPTQGFCGDFIDLDLRRVAVSGSDAADRVIPAVVPSAPAADLVTTVEPVRPRVKPLPPPQAAPASSAGMAKTQMSAKPASSPAAETRSPKAPATSSPSPVKARVLNIGKDQVRPLPPVPRGARYVQVGVFRNTANAERCVMMLEKLKLPLSRGKGRINGRSVDIILAGPFDDPWKLAEAMRAVRVSGYPDAYPR